MLELIINLVLQQTWGDVALMLLVITSPCVSITSPLFSHLLNDIMYDATMLICQGEQSVGSMGQVIEPYILKGSLDVFSEYAPYNPEDPYMLIDPYMINGI